AVPGNIDSSSLSFLKEGIYFLLLYSRRADSMDGLLMQIMSLMAASPRDRRWHQSNFGQRIMDDLRQAVLQLSQEAALAAKTEWHSGLWIAAAQLYLSYLLQSHNFGRARSSGTNSDSG
ncbi:MAG: hypothetical protein JW941_11835, partial [Candidatus Coatesbacteria bacterium]|nr:hypothetical protein [Candidatus Coatesbacteria bacterium]